MKRLFYFTGYRLTVMHWKGHEMIGSSSFEPTEKGLAQFRSYLLQTENIPGKFLVDVIEEDFRNEKIPHVGGRDRRAVIGRLIDRHYRASREFCYSEVIGREKQGRKDDTVLLGAMTNPQLMQPWLNIIDECEIALSGIWTLPLISRQLLKTIKATEGVVLLVSQQVSSNVRQTLFRDGKLVSSRQSIINQDINDISSIGELAAPEVTRTIDFLRAQNLIAAGETISLHLLGSREQIPSLEKAFQPDDRREVKLHLIEDIHDKLGIKGLGKKFSDGIFAWLCLRHGGMHGHYGPRRLFMRYYHRLMARALYAASLLVVVGAVLATVSNMLDAVEYEEGISLLKKEESSYRELYAKKFEAFEDVFQNAGIMNAAVDLAGQIKRNSKTSPLDFLIVLSNVLSQPGAGNINIDRIEWKAVSFDNRKKLYTLANFTDREPVRHEAVVIGRIDESEHNYRESVDHILRIISYLKNNPRVEEVEALTMPVDPRSQSQFSTEAGLDSVRESRAGEDKNRGRFSLHVIMRGPDDE
ncbi:MAG TPA: hypothetical protein ENJ11_00045 [Gammaproteobacteria bacterium]|nr:hypothetical protein [Gammaproteobacteria bacterium]